MRLQQHGHSFQDVSPGCRAVSSAVTKKVLVLLSLQRALQVELSPSETPYIDTIASLAAALYPRLTSVRMPEPAL